MKLFLDDFNVFNDMNTHLEKFHLCFNKCRTFGINLNPKKCMFMVSLELVLDTLYSRKANYWIPKDISHYQHFGTKNPQGYPSLQWYGLIYRCFIWDFTFIMAPITKLHKKTKTFEWISECQVEWEAIKQRCIDAPILIALCWDLDFMFIWMHPIWRLVPCWHKIQQANVIN